MTPANLFLPTAPERAAATPRAALPRLPARNAFIALWLVLSASAVVHAEEQLQG